MISSKNKVSKPISAKKRYVLRLLDLAKTDPQIGALKPIPIIREAATNPDLSLDRMVALFLDGYEDRPALGERTYEISTNSQTGEKTRKHLPSFKTITYGVFHSRIKGLANAWRFHPKCQVAPDEFVATIGFASIDFAVLDLACTYAQAVSIPLQSSTSGADLSEIFSNTKPVALAASVSELVMAAAHAVQQQSIRNLIVFDYDKRVDEELKQFEKAQQILREANVNTQLFTIDELVEYGQLHPWNFLPPHKDGEEKMTAIVHSSGSTGKPKGAMMPERALKHRWVGSKTQMPKLTVLFAPLNHLMGRNALLGTLNCGGTAYFTLKPDMTTLFEDIRLARPTFLTFFPRAFELIYQHYQNEVNRLFRAGEGDKEFLSELVKKEMSTTYLGDRLKGGVVGSAPTSPAVRDFIRDCFDMLLIDGYGNTESGSGAITIDGIIQRSTVLDYKLRDVPELGYYITDMPFPRGELCIKSKWGITGYYKQPNATKGLFDEEGYSLTGDIVEERGSDHVVVVDRRKDVLKLSQGEYVAVGVLGTVFEAASVLIKQIYIYGNSHRAYLVAVVVPELEVVKTILNGEIKTNKLKNLIRESFQKVGQKENLRSFEIPRDFIIDTEPFSQKNGLLSSVRKRLRPALKAKYSARLEALYEANDRDQEAALIALKDPNTLLSNVEKLGKLLEINLGIEDIDISKSRNFAELGGDSMGAVQFSMAIEEIFEVHLPANAILNPTGNLQSWAKQIESLHNQKGAVRPSFTNIHGKGANIVHAKDLQLVQFLGKDWLSNAKNAADTRTELKTVLLTGANGFLGHILCIEWLEQVASKNGKLICLIRAKDDVAARQRLDKEFEGVDAEMELRYKTLATHHLEVLAGDVSEANLGLNATNFQRLASEVDRICHPAALVNHRFAYPHLFGPNVVGVAEIIRLALTVRKKPIDFISSVAVERFLDTKSIKNEDSPLLASIKLTNHYAAGYGASKWAAEHLLHQANQDFELPSNIFRSDMILAHQEYRGQINTSDMLTRLLYSVIITGLAPISFYQTNANGSKTKAHYDGIPVDAISTAVIGVCKDLNSVCQVFNVQNYHQNDGVSLDSFVDWIESAGYSIQRIPNHQKWFERFKDKLNTLPENQRQQSAVDLLDAFSRPYPLRNKVAGCDNFKNLIHRLKVGNEIPHLSEKFVHKCLEDMKVLGMIE